MADAKKEYFNKGYDNYWRRRVTTENPENDKAPTEETFEYFFNKVEGCSKRKLLDIGCGYGRFFPIFYKANFEIYGVDLADGMISEAKRDYKDIVEELKVGTVECIEYPNNFFDIVIAWAMLDAVEQDKAFKEIFRVLKTNGIALLCGKNNNYWPDDKGATIAERKASEHGHPNYFTDYNLMKQHVKELGGEVLEEFFFERRGDWGHLKYLKSQPNKFYEWLAIVQKVAEPSSKLLYSKFYQTKSILGLENEQN